MKKLLTLMFCLAATGFLAEAQISPADLQGLWTLNSLEGNDTAIALSPEEIQASSDNYLHDFPLTLTTLTISGSDFTMTHHGTASMSGTFDVGETELILHAIPDGCQTCDPKDFIFLIRSFGANELVLDIFDGDEGSSSYARMNFTK